MQLFGIMFGTGVFSAQYLSERGWEARAGGPG